MQYIRKSLLFLILILVVNVYSNANIDSSFPKDQLFALGSYYYPEQWDEAQWERDLKKMSEMGISFTHFAEFAWAMLEPEEGKFDFTWLDKAVNIARKYGLKVILCTPSPTPPIWLSTNYPDVLIVNEYGMRLQHGRRQHASWSSDRYRKYVSRIVGLLAERYGNNPTVIGWQIDNEPGHYGALDYSENAQNKFRIWLENKYGNIDNLNRIWGNSFWSENYQNFGQIRLPNQQATPDKLVNPHAMLDMNRFMSDELASFINMQADILHGKINKNQWVTTNLIPVFNPADPVKMNKLDFTTYTRYLVTGHNSGIGEQGFRIGKPEDIGFSNDQFRNFIGNEFGVMELQPGQVNWGIFNPQPFPGAVRMWVYHVFAGGGKFVCNYRFRQPLRGSEQFHNGMILTDGVSLSPGGKEYVQIAKELKTLHKKYDESAVMPQSMAVRRTAILFDMNNYWEMEYQKVTFQWSTMGHVHKYYNKLKSIGAPVDVICEDKDFSDYPFLVAPAYQLLDSALVKRWEKYVANGGHLVLSCRTGLKNRENKLWEAPLGAPILGLCGIQSMFFDHMPDNLWGKIIAPGGENFEWNNWADVIIPEDGTEVWAEYTDQFYKGNACVVHKKIGNGSVTYIGADTDDGKLERYVLERLYREAGVKTENLPYGIVKEWRDGFYIALNYTSESYDLNLPSNCEIIIGKSVLQPAEVTIWKEK